MGLMADLSVRRTTREPATVQSSLLAAGGVLVGIGICAISLNIMWGGYDRNLLGGAVVAVGALSGLWFIAKKYSSYIVGSVAATQIIIPVVMYGMFIDRIDEGKIGLPILLIGLILGLFWALPGLRGRPTLLATAAGWITTGLATLTIESRIGYLDLEFDSVQFIAREIGVVVMALGIAQLIVGWNLDRKHWPNLATPFIGIGIYTALAGASGYLSAGDYGDAPSIILLIALSLGLIFIGGVANRRATTWIGTAFLTAGLIAFVISLLGDESGLTEFALLAVLFGVGLGAIGAKYATQLLAKHMIN